MKTLCHSLPLLVLLSLTPCGAQQIALLDAPVPVAGESTSAGEPGSSAIVPVSTRPAFSPKATFAIYDWSLLGAAATLRFLDYKSTVKCLSDPANFHEVELPKALVNNHPAFAAFETGTVVANYYAYRIFVRHHHRTMARLGQYINVGAMAWTVGGNYYGLYKYYPRN